MKFSGNPCLKLCSKFNKTGGFLANFDLKNAKNSMCFKLQMIDWSQVINAKTPMLEIARFYHRTVNFRQILSKFWQKSYKNLINYCFFQLKGKWLIMMKFQRIFLLRYKNFMKLSAILDQSHICSSKRSEMRAV